MADESKVKETEREVIVERDRSRNGNSGWIIGIIILSIILLILLFGGAFRASNSGSRATNNTTNTAPAK